MKGTRIFIGLLFLLTSKAALGDHSHILSQVITNDPALQDLSLDVVGVKLITPINISSDGLNQVEVQVRIEDVFRGRQKKGSILKLTFKDLRTLSADISDEMLQRASIVKPEKLLEGDRIIVSVDPVALAANQNAVYRYNSVTQYQITLQMAHESFLSRHRFLVGLAVIFLALLYLFKRKKPTLVGHPPLP